MIRLSTHIHNKSAKNSVVSAATKAARAARRAAGQKAGRGCMAALLLPRPWLSSVRLGAVVP